MQELVSENSAGLLDPRPADQSAEANPGDVMGPVKSVTEEMTDFATIVKLSYQSTVCLPSLPHQSEGGLGVSETVPETCQGRALHVREDFALDIGQSHNNHKHFGCISSCILSTSLTSCFAHPLVQVRDLRLREVEKLPEEHEGQD